MAQHILEGVGAPAFTPDLIGQHYVDTSSGDEYFSTGTSSSADWKVRGSGGGGAGGGFSSNKAMVGTLDNMSATVFDPGWHRHGIWYSKDGGKTKRFAEGCSKAGVGPNYGFFGAMHEAGGKILLSHADFISDGATGGATHHYIRITNDLGETWTEIRTLSGTRAGPHAGFFSKIAVQSDNAANYLILCNESGTDDYALVSTDTGASWTPTVISGSLLTALDGGAEPAFLYSWNGFFFCMVDQGGVNDGQLHKSSDGGATWALYDSVYTRIGCVPLSSDGAAPNISGLGYSDGIVITPSLGTFLFAQSGNLREPAVYRDTDGVSGFAQVFSLSSIVEWGFPSSNPDAYWNDGMFGFVIDPDGPTERVFGWFWNHAEEDVIGITSEDGTTWNTTPFVQSWNVGEAVASGYNHILPGTKFVFDGYAGQLLYSDGANTRYQGLTLDGFGLAPNPYTSYYTSSPNDTKPGNELFNERSGVARSINVSGLKWVDYD